ncbi:MAG: ABC transporter substrate-binding protein [Gammaproteobacteria bacterium]|nr:ABC transporter substrate-binding protein [Gammaproteobacteria bacterium]MBU1507228.1 ABC transporter substrate-binding protein [Gammaproteobacteria bacterium]MBU2121248.1 ABC transporter substrate-binding protein [Gammaproteobacteria bacterium]MBU2173143.1 ABC transporter substrate-binding protein [Gammaproteobacteria bacterium]MBU2201677.1 ABC transporter substrate-binding protein [Gammaproteobacteria bacterium]
MVLKHPAALRWARTLCVLLPLVGVPAAWSQAPGASAPSIVLGQSVALTGPGAALALPFQQGAKLHFDRVNAAGGIGGRPVELVTLDDAGSPEQAAANTQKLLAQNPLALFGYYGSPQVTASYKLLKDSDVLLFAPMAGGDEFRGAVYPNVFTLRPGYSEESMAVMRHAATLGARKLAILHATDSDSMAALEAAENTLNGLGANLVFKGAITAPDKALVAKPESLLVIGDARSAATAIRDLRAQGFRGQVYGFSNTGESLLAELLGSAGAGVVVVRGVPRSDNSRLAIVRDLQADAAAAKLGKPNVYMLEGYIAARVMTEALRRMGKDITRTRLRTALETMEDLNLGGFRVHFAGERVASRLLELGLIDAQGRVRE